MRSSQSFHHQFNPPVQFSAIFIGIGRNRAKRPNPSFLMESVNFHYGNDEQRIKCEFSQIFEYSNYSFTRYYFGDFEIEKKFNPDETTYYHYLAGADGLFAILKIEGTTSNLYYVHTDYLGSYQVISDDEGNKLEHFSYDPWGRRRNPADWTFNNVPDPVYFYRGYTGHEHLDWFGLINMNARLYDSFLGRFLSPDPQVQSPDYGQNYNRYSYALNNPLKYTDPSGEFFIIDSWIVGLISGGWKEANKRALNDIKVWGGLFASDPNKSFGGRVWETISRFTWQLPQTLGGFITSHTYNTIGLKGGVESVNYKYGATVLRTRKNDWGGITQGSFIVGNNSIEADADNTLFQHEYGHYIQSQSMGWAYYPRAGIPSLVSAQNKDPNHEHDFY